MKIINNKNVRFLILYQYYHLYLDLIRHKNVQMHKICTMHNDSDSL